MKQGTTLSGYRYLTITADICCSMLVFELPSCCWKNDLLQKRMTVLLQTGLLFSDNMKQDGQDGRATIELYIWSKLYSNVNNCPNSTVSFRNSRKLSIILSILLRNEVVVRRLSHCRQTFRNRSTTRSADDFQACLKIFRSLNSAIMVSKRTSSCSSTGRFCSWEYYIMRVIVRFDNCIYPYIHTSLLQVTTKTYSRIKPTMPYIHVG